MRHTSTIPPFISFDLLVIFHFPFQKFFTGKRSLQRRLFWSHTNSISVELSMFLLLVWLRLTARCIRPSTGRRDRKMANQLIQRSGSSHKALTQYRQDLQWSDQPSPAHPSHNRWLTLLTRRFVSPSWSPQWLGGDRATELPGSYCLLPLFDDRLFSFLSSSQAAKAAQHSSVVLSHYDMHAQRFFWYIPFLTFFPS